MHQRALRAAFVGVALFSGLACQTAPAAAPPSVAAPSSAAAAPSSAAAAPSSAAAAPSSAGASSSAAAEGTFTFAFLVRGPSAGQRTPAEREAIQAAHLGNIGRLGEEKKLLIAGPFGDENPHPEVRGIFLFDTADLATARDWTNSDPAVRAGVLGMELATCRSSSPVRRVSELEKRMREELARSGAEVKMEATIRGYAMVLGKDPMKAEQALAPIRDKRKLLFECRLEGSERARYIAVLDAETVEAASSLFGADRAGLGEHEIVSWWSTRSLVGLAAPR